MSIKPPINCPPDYSILAFRLTECKKASVVKGVTALASLDLNSLAIPIKYHSEGAMILRGNSIKDIDIDGIAETWPLNEKFNFRINLTEYPDAIGDGTSHEYTLYDEDLNALETISFTVNSADPAYADFNTALRTAYGNSSIIKTLVNFSAITFSNVTLPPSGAITGSSLLLEDGSSLLLESEGLFLVESNIDFASFTISASKKNVKYRHVFNFDTTGLGGFGPFLHPGNLVTPYTKYPKGRIKYILVYAEFENVDTSTCGCADSSGLMKSNQKYFQHTTKSEYDNVTLPKTPIILDGGILGDNEITWQQTSTDHIGYHIKVGDLISTVENPLFRAIVTDIDGYRIMLDQNISPDLTVANQQVQHTYSPSVPQWKNVGPLLFLSGATDVTDDDRCYIETVTLKNPHSFDIPIKYMIGT